MTTKQAIAIVILTLVVFAPLTGNVAAYAAVAPDKSTELSADLLRDKIRGGLLGQILNNIK